MEVFRYKKPLDLMSKSKTFWYLVYCTFDSFYWNYHDKRLQLRN